MHNGSHIQWRMAAVPYSACTTMIMDLYGCYCYVSVSTTAHTMADKEIPISYTSLTDMPQLMSGHRDKRLKETVMYVASIDDNLVRKQRCASVTCIALLLLPALVNPLLVILYFVFIPLILWSFKSYLERWEFYITEKTLCHINPISPKGFDFYAIPLDDIAAVGIRREDRICWCCCQLPGQVLVINLKPTAPAISVNTRRRVFSTRTFEIKFVKNIEYAAEFLRQQSDV